VYRLDREIVERRDDVTLLQQQLLALEGKFNTLSMSVFSDTTEVKRTLAAVLQSCETCQKGLEHERREGSQFHAALEAKCAEVERKWMETDELFHGQRQDCIQGS